MILLKRLVASLLCMLQSLLLSFDPRFADSTHKSEVACICKLLCFMCLQDDNCCSQEWHIALWTVKQEIIEHALSWPWRPIEVVKPLLQEQTQPSQQTQSLCLSSQKGWYPVLPKLHQMLQRQPEVAFQDMQTRVSHFLQSLDSQFILTIKGWVSSSLSQLNKAALRWKVIVHLSSCLLTCLS